MQHHRPFIRFALIAGVIIGLMFLLAPESSSPKNLDNICAVLKKRQRWYWAARSSRQQWGVPISTQMAIIFRESRFHATAKPAREKLFQLLPWRRPTSAEGYAQAVDSTWRAYLKDTHQRGASRNDFVKAVDFIGWYINRIHHRLGIPINDTYHLYLAYHEGMGGYRSGSYRKRPHLIRVAVSVTKRAERYRKELLRCEREIPRHQWQGWF